MGDLVSVSLGCLHPLNNSRDGNYGETGDSDDNDYKHPSQGDFWEHFVTDKSH